MAMISVTINIIAALIKQYLGTTENQSGQTSYKVLGCLFFKRPQSKDDTGIFLNENNSAVLNTQTMTILGTAKKED